MYTNVGAKFWPNFKTDNLKNYEKIPYFSCITNKAKTKTKEKPRKKRKKTTKGKGEEEGEPKYKKLLQLTV